MENKLNNKSKTVVVGISGGVDSAVSAYLLKEDGYNVIGLFMQNWDSAANFELNYNSEIDACESELDFRIAKTVADHLNIPLYRVEFIKEYWDNVFSYFLEEYKNNRTPNPDIFCNKYIKFDAFLKYALQQFGADYIAMGHYAKVIHYDDHSELLVASDQEKDQTYFLCQLNQHQLKKALFPIGHLNKSQVREIAKNISLPNFDRKDSTGICFIGERNFKKFLENYIPNKPGNILDISTNKIIGKHFGAMYYTIGQRKGLNLGGLSERYFVCKKDLEEKIIYVAPNRLEKEYLWTNKILIKNFNWITNPNFSKQIFARFRHRQNLQIVKVEIGYNNLYVSYSSQKNIVPGQFCVLYQENKCLGGGIIEQTFLE